jgi:hypothetical protein
VTDVVSYPRASVQRRGARRDRDARTSDQANAGA